MAVHEILLLPLQENGDIITDKGAYFSVLGISKEGHGENTKLFYNCIQIKDESGKTVDIRSGAGMHVEGSTRRSIVSTEQITSQTMENGNGTNDYSEMTPDWILVRKESGGKESVLRSDSLIINDGTAKATILPNQFVSESIGSKEFAKVTPTYFWIKTPNNGNEMVIRPSSININNKTWLVEDGFKRIDDNTHQSNLLMKGYNDCREMSISEQFESYSSTIGLVCGSTNGGVPFFAVWGSPTNLGNPGRMWKQIYANTSTISTSDRNKKKDISYMGEETGIDTELSDDTLVEFIMSLKPCVYRFIENDSNRPHHGMISQDIEEIIQSGLIPDHAGFIKSPKVILVEDKDEDGNVILDENGNSHYHDEIVEGEYDYSLRNEEFISDIIRFSQILKEENDTLKQRVKTLEDTLAKVLEKLDLDTETN